MKGNWIKTWNYCRNFLLHITSKVPLTGWDFTNNFIFVIVLLYTSFWCIKYSCYSLQGFLNKCRFLRENWIVVKSHPDYIFYWPKLSLKREQMGSSFGWASWLFICLTKFCEWWLVIIIIFDRRVEWQLNNYHFSFIPFCFVRYSKDSFVLVWCPLSSQFIVLLCQSLDVFLLLLAVIIYELLNSD